MASLEGKVIAITGAASGIGLSTAHLLASRGAALALADVRQGPLDDAVTQISKINAGARIYAQAVNVVESGEVAAWLDEAIKQFGKLDGAANLAGIAGSLGRLRLEDYEDWDWDTVLDVNLKGVFNCVRAELKRMKADASIVNASSVAGLRGANMGAAYAASKASTSHQATLPAALC